MAGIGVGHDNRWRFFGEPEKMSFSAHCGAMAIVLLAAAHVGASEPTLRPITDAETLLAVYTRDDGLGSSGKPKLIVAAWNDGYIVWSEDRLRGGAPYCAGQIDPKRLGSLLSSLEREGLFSEKSLDRGYYPPESEFTTILIRVGERRIEMCSWHELEEADGNNRALLQRLKSEPPEYLLFRYVWSEVRARAAELVPASQSRVSGDVLMKHGIMSWHETDPRKEPPK